MHWEEKLKRALKSEPSSDLPTSDTRMSSVFVLLGTNKLTGVDEILLTKRTMLVETHKGQISFPGGFRAAADKSLLETAWRECQEEIGVSPADIVVLGRLENVRTRGDVWITPWVGRLPFPYPVTINPGEVEKIFYLPLETLLSQGLQPMTVDIENFSVKSIGIRVGGELVWGATAKMLEQLRNVLLGP